EHAVLNTMIAAASPKEIFARMLRNLRAIYLKQGDQLKALRAADRIIMLSPGAAEEYRERAQLYLELECFRAALSDFRSYVRLKPDAPDSASATRRIAELEPLAARLN